MEEARTGSIGSGKRGGTGKTYATNLIFITDTDTEFSSIFAHAQMSFCLREICLKYGTTVGRGIDKRGWREEKGRGECNARQVLWEN